MSRILIIEDEPGNRTVLRSRLADQGYEAVAAESGAQGLAEARSGSYDLLLVSACLASGVDSLEVCRRLKAAPETHALPLVLFSNRAGGPEEVERGYEAGCEAFVTRAEQPTLEHVLRILLRLKGSLDTLREQNRQLEDRSRRAASERQRAEPGNGAAAQAAGSGSSAAELVGPEHHAAVRELAAGKPDGIAIVDSEGCVRWADRGACEILGARLDGQHLGQLAPATGLEAFVRDAHTDARTGFRFEASARRGSPPRSVVATVLPLVVGTGEPGFKALLLADGARRRLATELLRLPEPALPLREAGAWLEAAREVYAPAGLVGASPAMELVRQAVQRAASAREHVTVLGPAGSGRRRVTRTLHHACGASGGYVEVACGALHADELERELFGWVRGGFDGALEDRPGLAHRAQDGTLVLVDLDALPVEVAPRLTRLAGEGALERVGASKTERLSLRVVGVATTGEEDGAVLRDGPLGELCTLLGAHVIELPPLAARDEDLELLAQRFVAELGGARGIERVSEPALWLLEKHDWPGNVAELREVLAHACARAEGPELQLEDLPSWLVERHGRPAHDLIPRAGAPARSPSVLVPHGTGGVRREARPWDITDDDPVSFEVYEKKALLRAIEVVGGDKLAAARLLKVGKSTLYRKLKRYGIT